MTMDEHDLRSSARESVARARAEISSGVPHRYKYAALELREAMEALTYSRALAFKDFLPPEEYNTWQPRKLMSVLIDIDPSIGWSSSLAFIAEAKLGQIPSEGIWSALGKETVLTMADIKGHYDALGSYFHVPSLEQVKSGRLPDFSRLRQRCETLADIIDQVLASRVWNITLGVTSTLPECANEKCKKPIRKRIPTGKDSLEVQCFECKAEYLITRDPDNKVNWKPKMTDIRCSTPTCSRTMPLWPTEIRPGTHWQCAECGVNNQIALAVGRIEDGKKT